MLFGFHHHNHHSQSRTTKATSNKLFSKPFLQTNHSSNHPSKTTKMFGLDAPKITRREFDGSDPQLQLAMAYAASKKSATSVSTSAVSSARPSVDDEKRNFSTSSGKSASSLTKNQKKRFSFFQAAGTVLSLK